MSVTKKEKKASPCKQPFPQSSAKQPSVSQLNHVGASLGLSRRKV
jgi:hypothetical protein